MSLKEMGSEPQGQLSHFYEFEFVFLRSVRMCRDDAWEAAEC